jgi:hypothetical protein
MSAWEELRLNAVGILGRILLRFWWVSCPLKILGEEEYLRLRRSKKPVIFLVWHGRLLLVPWFFRGRGVGALISPSRDGEILIRIGSKWDYKIFRGSSSHSIVRAWVEMKKELDNGGELILVPDGPRGPYHNLKAGCLKLARETGAVLVPFSYSASRKKFLKSWDRFLFYYPFSKIVAIYGTPIAVDSGLDEEQSEKERARVERVLIELDAEADSYFGREAAE